MKNQTSRVYFGPRAVLKTVFLVAVLLTIFNFCFIFDLNWFVEPPPSHFSTLPFLIPSRSHESFISINNVTKATAAIPARNSFRQSELAVKPTTAGGVAKQKCEIPKLTPGDAMVYQLDYQQAAPTGRLVDPVCVNNSAAKFFADVNGKLIPNMHPANDKFWSSSTCFYKPFWRIRGLPDFSIKYGVDVPISIYDEGDIKLQPEFEFFRVFCFHKASLRQRRELVYEDVVTTVRPKQEIETSLEDRPANKRGEFYSVLIFGMDSTSHMNFRRHMPLVHNYLVNQMGAVEFNGFNSLGPGTLWSILAMLTGMDLEELRGTCLKNPTDFMDSCPWIWKEFEAAGYRTGYAEDEMSGTPTFNERPGRGFSRQPWHYDFRPAAMKFENVRIGHNAGRVKLPSFCWGSHLAFDQLVDYTMKFANAFVDKPYWYFTWSVALSHKANWYNRYSRPSLLNMLKILHGKKRLNNTVVIVLSDHGMRYGPLRQQTRQGFLEERLPMLYISLPLKFRTKYTQAFKNFRENSNRLTSALDIYATMKDLLHTAENVTDKRIKQRSTDPSLEAKRGVSLFLPISANRDCKTIGLAKHFTYCACRNRQSLTTNSTDVMAAAHATVQYINRKISGFSKCARLRLKRIIEGYRLDVDFSLSDERARFNDTEHRSKEVVGAELEIDIETTPGGGRFYVGVVKQRLGWNFVVTDISRMSAYGNDVDCVDLKELKPFCFCGD